MSTTTWSTKMWCKEPEPDYKKLYEMSEFKNELLHGENNRLRTQLAQAREDYKYLLGCEHKKPWRELTLNQIQTIAMTNRHSQINLACDIQKLLKDLNS
jgi:hypothetical protein